MAVAPQELWAHSTWPTGDPKEWLETPNQSMNEQLAMKVMLSKEPPVLTTIGFPPAWVKTQSRAIWPLAAVSKWRGWVLSWDSTVEGSTVVFALFPLQLPLAALMKPQ